MVWPCTHLINRAVDIPKFVYTDDFDTENGHVFLILLEPKLKPRPKCKPRLKSKLKPILQNMKLFRSNELCFQFSAIVTFLSFQFC